MDNPASPAALLCARLLAEWLEDRSGRAVSLDAPLEVRDATAWVARGGIGEASLTLGTLFLVPPSAPGIWHEAQKALEARIGGSLTGGFILWAPPGAELPAREPTRSDFITRVEAVAADLGPGARAEVRFPITLYLRKSDEEGGYLTARGGLAPHWARFTGRVFGHYQLDSTELHRLPAADGYLSTLIDSIALTANSLKLGDTEAIEAEDAWTIQRLRDGSGLAIVGEPPSSDLSSGSTLRRNLRRAFQTLRGPLTASQADLRVLGIVGPYATFKDQPVGTALLGMDPASYGGLDLILLAADGEVGPILDLTRSPLLSGAGGPA
jgi:hypothetical protein